MAFATGSINFKAAPAPGNGSIITLNDGQSSVGSRLQIGFLAAISGSDHKANTFLSGTIEGQVPGDAGVNRPSGAGHKIRAGNASNLVTLYLTGNTSTAAFFDFKLGAHNDEDVATFRSNFVTDGAKPAVLVFRQPGFNDLKIDFHNASSGFTATSGLGSFGRKNAASDYSVNLNGHGNLVTGLNTIRAILNAASTSGEIDVKNQSTNPSSTSNYQRIMEDRTTNAALQMSLALEVSGGASNWTSANSTFMTVVPLLNNAVGHRQAAVTASNEVVYANRGAFRTGGTDALSNAELATYVSKIINQTPIRISASSSGANVLLTHTVDGASGDVSITKTDSNITVVGMTGGTPSTLDGEVTGTIGTSGGLVRAGNTVNNPSAQVNIPNSSLSENKDISIAILSQSATTSTSLDSITALPEAPAGAKARSDVIRYLPHGTTFSVPVILSWNITGSTSGIKVFRRANASSNWAAVADSDYSFSGGKVHVTSSTFSDYMAVGGSAVAITKIGTKLLANTAVTTVKLGTSAVQRDDVQSGSVQVTHLDLSSQARNDHVDFLDTDFLVAGDSTNSNARVFSFSQLKTALSLSNAARGDTGTVQFQNTGFDGIAGIRTDNVNLTASNGSKIVFAFTGISGSTSALSASSKTALRVDTKEKVEFAINGANELVLNASRLEPEVDVGLNLGLAAKTYNNAFVSLVSGSGTSTLHKLDADEGDFRKVIAPTVSGSGTSTLHNIDIDEGTFGGVKFSSQRASAAYQLSGSGTAQIHKVDSDEGNFRKISATVVTGSGTSTFHKIDVDQGVFNKIAAVVVTGSGTSTLHKLDADAGDFRKVVSTNITSSGATQLHNLSVSDISGAVGEFRKVTTDEVIARVIKSDVTTSENFEVSQKQFIPAVSASAGTDVEGAGLQIGGTAGTGSAGIASVILGDAGSGAGSDLIFKIGSVQGSSLSGSISDGGQRFGVTGTLSASIGVFHTLTIAKGIGNQNSIFSGSSFVGHLISGSTANIFDLDVNRASLSDIDGTSLTVTTLSSSTSQIHSADVDKVTVNDLDGANMALTTVSGTTVQAHTVDADKATTGDVDVVSLSGSSTSVVHKLNSDVLSGSRYQSHVADIDKITISDLTSNDVIKKAHLNSDITRDTDSGHGGLTFNNGQLSIGWTRRIFSRSSKKLINRSAPTQGSGSLYTTCSLPTGVIIASGSERVYFNGLLLTKGNSTAGNPRDADYSVDYNSVNGPVNIFLHESLTMDSDDVVVVQFLSGANPA